MNVILWGAGTGGNMALYMKDITVNILAIIDSDVNKIGKMINNIDIISCYDIEKYNYDYVVISNVHGLEIKEKLTHELNIPFHKIFDIYNFGSFDSRIGILNLIKSEIDYRNLEGDVAELGVYKGDFAKYINRCFPNKKLFLYDTFEGFDERDLVHEKERNKSFDKLEKGQFFQDDINLVLDKMLVKKNCVVRKGFFPSSAKDDFDCKFCFVSIDADLYKPIYEGLNFFYDKLVYGGYIMVHDYNNPQYEGAKEAVRKFSKEKNIYYTPVSDLNGSIVITK